ncbi:hypothetical protein HID58_066005 [Brassica napus]|uniref:Uncharacterized protein n=3 Tax=Brassica TaxID=3705 RepID=A0ABQ7ZEF7_BRANA|nr:hypothetical protein HID58_066005 [Brassica napus]CDY59333.1 BnaC05g51040D [Brassica napus]
MNENFIHAKWWNLFIKSVLCFWEARNVRCGGKLIVEAASVFLRNFKLRRVWCKDSRGDKQTNAWLGAAGHVIRTERTVFKIRKALPKSVFN